MTDNRFNRLILLLGEDAFARLQQTNVILFGVGGVGSWCAEALIRSGVGNLTMVDCDIVDITNINRQLPALSSTIGQEKAETLKNRLLDINPNANITAIRKFYTAETESEFNLSQYDFVIDAIDTLSDKALLILKATSAGKQTTLFSSMGAALKTDASKIDVTEFWKATGCPLAAALRRKFKKSGQFPAKKFKVVYSPELYANRGIEDLPDLQPDTDAADFTGKKVAVNGSLMHTTAIFGLRLAGLVIESVINNKLNSNKKHNQNQ